MWKEVNRRVVSILALAMSLGGSALQAGCVEEPQYSEAELEELTTPEEAHEIDPLEPISAGFDSCLPGAICFYTGKAGGGKKCSWTAHDTDWASGSSICSWALTANVCSVYNRTSERVEYFRSANYADRIGSTLPTIAGDLACTYKLRSHRFQR